MGYYPLAGMILASSMFELSRSGGTGHGVKGSRGCRGRKSWRFLRRQGDVYSYAMRLLSIQAGARGSHSFHPVALKSFLESSTRAYDHCRRSGPLPGARHDVSIIRVCIRQEWVCRTYHSLTFTEISSFSPVLSRSPDQSHWDCPVRLSSMLAMPGGFRVCLLTL